MAMKSFSNVDNNNNFLDKKLNNLFNNKKNGFFIELGANDGLKQSNTAFFERYMNWTGILIEPSLKGYESCKINRPKSISLNYACVGNDFKDNKVKGDFKDNSLMSSIRGKRRNRKSDSYVETITLEKILDNHHIKNIDFLSLDTEGFELNILEGLNLDRHRPNYILVEIYNKDYNNIIKLLTSKKYELHSNFSNYNKVDNPRWDGSHNDYLFKKI